MGYSETDLACIAEKICIGCRRREAVQRRRCDACSKKLNAKERRRHSLAAQIRRRLKGYTESKYRSYIWTKQEEERMRTSAEIIKTIRSLSDKKRQEIESIVRRHMNACQKIGVQPESIDRVWIEAIESVRLGHKVDEEPEPYQPRRQYAQYISPRGEA